MRDGATALSISVALLCLLAASAANVHTQDDWDVPMEAYAHQVLNTWSGHDSSASRGKHTHAQPGARSLLGHSRQSQLTGAGSGILRYEPTGYNIDGGDFTKFFQEAHANANVTGMRLSPGTYHVSAKVEEGFHVVFTCDKDRMQPFEIDFSGVFLYFTDYRFGGTRFDACHYVNFHGPYEQTWVNGELPFTQGKILSVDESTDPGTMTVQVDEGYPSDQAMLQEPLSILIFTNTTRLMQNVPCPYVWTKPNDVSGRQKLGSNIYKFLYRSQKIIGCSGGPGDLFVARRPGDAKGLVVGASMHSTFQDISIYSANGFGMFQTEGGNNSYMRIQVRPFPRPLGNDGAMPLMSSTADIFHIVNPHGATIIRDNFFVNSGDDGVAMHGEYYAVAAADPSKRSVVVASTAGFPFDRNDSLTFYSPDLECWGTGIIQNLYSVDQPSESKGLSNSVVPNMNYDDADFMQVVLTAWPEIFNNIRTGGVISCPSSDGSGFAIVNNTIGNLRGRGILCKGSDGVIADNTLFNLPGMALQLTSEQEWGEADFVHNILVSNNVINSNGSGIWLGSSPDINKQPLVYTNNYAVDFVGNKIVNVHTAPLTITSSAQVTVTNTSFVNAMCVSGATSPFEWATPGALVFMANVNNVSFAGNQILNNENCRQPSGNYAHPVSMVNATNITGLEAPTLASLLQRDGSP